MEIMTAYELMTKTNHYLLSGGELTDGQKAKIVKELLGARNSAGQTDRFHRAVRAEGGADREGRRMYPVFYIPPFNDGKKLKTILGQTPKTQILSANAYELEILRLLCLFAPDNPEVREMTEKTLKRLKTTCFGYLDDGVGECFDTSLVVLRFLVTAAPHEIDWIESRIKNYTDHVAEKKRPAASAQYFELCMKEYGRK